ncbi:MAG: response regulator, partial [Magnetococcales bacterium]|nr:response regulator [Magnetococcales bacterium]
LMGGNIQATSLPGQGSEFTFAVIIPRHSENRRKRPVLPEALLGKRVLLAEDHPLCATEMTGLLGAIGLIPTAVDSGARAIKTVLDDHVAGAPPFALALLDWTLPTRNGVETAVEIRAFLGAAGNSPAPVFFLLVPFGVETPRTSGRLASVDAFIDKPITRSRLVRVITEVMGEKQAPASDRRAAPVLSLENETGNRVAGGRILLVEDNPINRQVARELLERVGVVVDEAESGEKALSWLDRYTYDAVLMDVQMPGWNGMETTRRLRRQERFRELPIVALTAHSQEEDRKLCLEAGMNAFLNKPIRPERLYGVLSQWIRRPLEPPPTGPSPSVASLPEIPGLDIAAGLARLSGNLRLYRLLLDRFRDSYQNSVKEIEEAFHHERWPEVDHLAHAIRGVAANLGAVPLAAAAANLEQTLAAGDGEQLQVATTAFVHCLSSLLEALGGGVPPPRLALPPTTPWPSITLDPVDHQRTRLLLTALISHLRHHSLAANIPLRELGNLLGPPTVAHLTEIGRQIGEYRFDEALAGVRRLIAILPPGIGGEVEETPLPAVPDERRVLIVDDQRGNLDVLREILADFHCLVALDGHQGIRLARNASPDIIILDIMMPEIDGFEVCRRLKADALTHPIPVIFVTAKREAEDESEGFRVGAADYITKPYSPEIVRRRILHHMELKSHQDHLEKLVAQRTAELAEAKREAETRREAAEAGNRAKSEFLATMSHEIRTPLNAILGLGELLLESEVTPEQRRYLETARRASESLLGLVSDILDLSKIEAGQLDLELGPFELPALLEQILDIQLDRAREKGITLRLVVAEAVPRRVLGDANRLRQILLNLLSNAIKFTPAGEVTLKVWRGATPDLLSFIVTDTGIGIPPEKLGIIFQPFVQAEASTTRRFGGSGLGLAICHRLTTMMGGRIEVASTAGEGSTFTLSIPLRPVGTETTGTGTVAATNHKGLSDPAP